jgi:hypothetical protein
MTISLSTIRRLWLVPVVVFATIAVAGPAAGGTGQGAPPQSAIDAASANWAAKAKLLDAYGQPKRVRVPPQSAIDAASANWAAKAKLLDAYGQPVPGATLEPASGGHAVMDWNAFGIGAGAVLGLVFLAGGLGAGAHYTSKRRVRPRPAA